MADLDRAVSRLSRAVTQRERIAVFGDYDADGITATALAVWSLRELGADVRPWLANRFYGGYGLAPQAIDEFLADARSLALVVDCGTSDHDALARAKKLGLDVIVVDHHPPSQEIPDVTALVNPHRPDCSFEYKGMASVGLVFYLMGALRTKLSADLDVREGLDLVAVGTIADVAPMSGVNRTLVRKGLERLGKQPRPGLAALQVVAGAVELPTSNTIAFKLGPRINAAGRLGTPMVALELLLAKDYGESQSLASRLDGLSRERREIQKKIIEAALPIANEQYQRNMPAILVGGDNWHQGVIGIVAARFCDEFERPTGIVGFEDGIGRGSIRAPAGYNLNCTLKKCAPWLEKFGGHAGAAGFTVKKECMSDLTREFCASIEEQTTQRKSENTIVLEGELEPKDLTLMVISELERLGPFGINNQEPVFLYQDARVLRCDERTGGHISAVLESGSIQVKCFGPHMASSWPRSASRIDVAACLRRNTYRGMDQVELRLVDVKPVAEHEICS